MASRAEVVKLARSWIGLNEADGSYKKILDIYNSQKNPPRGLKMKAGWSWCAATWSALAIKLGYTKIMPVEISCGELINISKKMGIWKENDNYVPDRGDAILYDWDDSFKGDCVGWPDHIGVVERVDQSAGYFTVIEGNYKDSVKRRTVSINGRYIRGFITPKYDENGTDSTANMKSKSIVQLAHEVIGGEWGNEPERSQHLRNEAYDPVAVQKKVNEILNGSAVKARVDVQDQRQPYNKRVICTCTAATLDDKIYGTYKTTADLYCRNDAGTNKKALCLIPQGTRVFATGARTGNWYVIEVVLDGVLYKGFSHNSYLKKV